MPLLVDPGKLNAVLDELALIKTAIHHGVYSRQLLLNLPKNERGKGDSSAVSTDDETSELQAKVSTLL